MGHIYHQPHRRNKRSIALDLKQPQGTRCLTPARGHRRRVRQHMYGRRRWRRSASSYEDIRAINPRIVLCAAPLAMAPRGRYAGKPAYDDLIQGLTGIATIPRDAWGG